MKLGEGSGKSKRPMYKCVPEMKDDPLPMHMTHSKRSVRDEIYLATTDFIGIGLSSREALTAVEIVSNWCFGRKFHQTKAQVEFGGVGGGKDFYAIRGGFGILCRWNLRVWVAGRTFMPSGVDLVHCVGGIWGCGWWE
jgi:hypothetical protein